MKEKHNLLGFALVTAFVALAATATAEWYACGDADGNEIVNVSDAVYLITYIFGGGPEPSPLLAGDADGNEIVNVSDAVYMISYIFGGGPEPICPYGMVTDIDGNVYRTIKIGDQWWMMENLKVTHYRNGDPVPNVTDAGAWSGLTTGAYCNYDNDESYVAVYGRLYNWYAVDDSRCLAPGGWHLPTDGELKQLEMYLGMSQSQADTIGYRGTDEGGKLKEAGTMHWSPPNIGATNESGFTALPAGNRLNNGDFPDPPLGHGTGFWSSTEAFSANAWNRGLIYSDGKVFRGPGYKRTGLSVRCVRD